MVGTVVAGGTAVVVEANVVGAAVVVEADVVGVGGVALVVTVDWTRVVLGLVASAVVSKGCQCKQFDMFIPVVLWV